MKGLNKISVVSTAESALKKLKRASIPVYDCEKRGADFTFCIKDKHMKKVFAIFKKPCYNIRTEKLSPRGRLADFIFLRVGLIAGVAAFFLAALISNSYILKIEIGGNGRYLDSEIRSIVLAEGAKEGKLFSGFNLSLATGKILALPQVVFCNIQKKGSTLLIDVRVDEEMNGSSERRPLVADRQGVVENIVAICGTPAINVGTKVKTGDILIFAHNIVGEEEISCLAVGYADIRCTGKTQYFAERDDEASRKEALASVKIEGEEISSRLLKVVPADGGVVFEISYEYLHRVSINLT